MLRNTFTQWTNSIRLPLTRARHLSSHGAPYRGQTFKRYISSPYVPLAIMAGWISSELALLLKYRNEDDVFQSRMRNRKTYLERLIANAKAGEDIDVDKVLLQLHETDQGLEFVMDELEKNERLFSGSNIESDEAGTFETAKDPVPQHDGPEREPIPVEEITSAKFL